MIILYVKRECSADTGRVTVSGVVLAQRERQSARLPRAGTHGVANDSEGLISFLQAAARL